VTSSRTKWIVDFTEGAVRDFDGVKGKEERKAIFNAIATSSANSAQSSSPRTSSR